MVPVLDVLWQKYIYLVTPEVLRGVWVGWTENIILTFCVTNLVWMLPLKKCLWKIPSFLRLWTAISLILPSFTKDCCLNNYISHWQLAKRQINFWANENDLRKGFYYDFHVIYSWSLFALLFQKLKKCPDFWIKNRVSRIKVSENFPIRVFLRCAADEMFIEVLLF